MLKTIPKARDAILCRTENANVSSLKIFAYRGDLNFTEINNDLSCLRFRKQRIMILGSIISNSRLGQNTSDTLLRLNVELEK